MSVKRSRSASRVLAVLEEIAYHQPIGVSELARLLEDDKSAVQRAIMTLADDGWINPAPGSPRRWKLSAHMLTLANAGHSRDDLRIRAKGVMETLRAESGETVLLTVPDSHRFVVIEALESQQLLRTAPHIGMTVPVWGSATGRAILPYMTAEGQADMLRGTPDQEMLEDFSQTLARGYSVSDGDIAAGSINIAAPIVESDGWPVGAIVISAPRDRVTPTDHTRIGAMVVRAARSLSRGNPVISAPPN